MKSINIFISFDGETPVVNNISTNNDSDSVIDLSQHGCSVSLDADNLTNNKPEPITGEYVKSPYLLYKLSDAGLLESLKAVVWDKKLKRNVWVFDENNPDVKAVKDKFFADMKSEKNRKKEKSNNDDNIRGI